MANQADQILDQAISWNIRLRSGDAETWQDFTRWLEADSAHVRAYEQVAILDADLDGLAPAVAPSPILRQRREPIRRRWMVGGAAAAIAASTAALLILAPSSTNTVTTNTGETRTIALQDGSRIHLNGDTAVTIERDNPRYAVLERGEALFVITSDPSKPFSVEAGPATIHNLGTVFNVEREASSVEVELASGAVSVTAAGQTVDLTPGQVALVKSGTIQTTRRVPETIGTWRSGELSYSAASITDVARDVSRASGIRILAEPAVAQRQFSGTIILNEDREQLRQTLGAVLNVEIRLADNEWILAAPDR